MESGMEYNYILKVQEDNYVKSEFYSGENTL